jgi:hypothetical protein
MENFIICYFFKFPIEMLFSSKFKTFKEYWGWVLVSNINLSYESQHVGKFIPKIFFKKHGKVYNSLFF